MSILKLLFPARQGHTKEQLQNSNSFCIMPWVHFHVTQYGTVTPCCQAPWQQEQAFGDINTQSIKEIWHGTEMNRFRKHMLAGKTDERCNSCFVKEKAGFTSLRNITNKKYGHRFDLALSGNKDGKTESLPVYFDIRFSNVCNLKCRICGPWSSSGWYNDAMKLGMLKEGSKALTYSFNNPEYFLSQFAEMAGSLEELYFAGGEPLVMEEHYQVLNLLIEHKRTDVRLTYNTNFSSFSYKHYNLFELWKQFNTISVAASLDASGKRGEFLRKNSDWNEVVANRQQMMKELPHIEFIVSATLNTYNVLHLPDFHKEWVEQGLIRVEDFIPTLLVQPKELSIRILPQKFKAKAGLKYAEHIKWISVMPYLNKEKRDYMITQFENIIKALASGNETEDINLFRENSKKMDQIREEKTLDVFPELIELF